jgi:F420 biosynthesis protein FbiB-like protein
VAADIWDYFDRLLADCELVIDRPKGSAHPRYPQFLYPLDYGYLAGTRGGDGDGIDVWLGSRGKRTLEGLLLTVDLVERDTEVKLLVACTDAEMQIARDVSNEESMRALLLPRSAPYNWLAQRRSIRRFQAQPVPRVILERVLAAASWAPSAHNRQPWRFAVLHSLTARSLLTEAMAGDFRRDLEADGLPPQEVELRVSRARQRVLQAPAAIVVCCDETSLDVYPDETRQAAEQMMAAQSVAMAGQNLLLAASAEGLGAVWMCAPLFVPQTVQQALSLPANWKPQGLVLLGYPAEQPRQKLLRPESEITIYL